MLTGTKSRNLLFVVAVAVLAASSCGGARDGATGESNANANATAETVRRSSIEASPVEAGDESYKVVTGESLTLTVQAPDAQKVDLLYRPVVAGDRQLRLKTLSEPSGGSFVYEMKTPADLNGEVWARVQYPSGEIKQTERLLLVSADEQGKAEEKELMEDPHGDESERSDKFTGGRVATAPLRPGDPDVRISVNVPAFRLTLWQDDKQVAAFPIGVGLREFPIPIGIRSAQRLILNPDWIPPDSEWVRESSSVEPFERIPADDPLNPLGKIKIPLGDAYLLHEAQSPSDIGNLVSHGCVRILRDDIFELSRMIARARDLPVTQQDFQKARSGSERQVVEFERLLPVDINYDTFVVEGGVLHIYPDVYRRDANTVENLRNELQSYGVDASRLDDATLTEMLKRVSGEERFVVSLEDIRAGRALERGRVELLVPERTTKDEKNPTDDRR